MRDLAPEPAVLGHPQYGLAKLLGKIGILRADVEEMVRRSAAWRLRARLVGEALRPAETTDLWAETPRRASARGDIAAAFAGVTLVEAPASATRRRRSPSR